MKAARVLVVDDEPQIQRFLKPALLACDYEVLGAETGVQALRLAATQAPAIMLLDLGLPDMDGKEVLSRLRAFSAIPVIILSAREREAEKIAALDLGASDYVEKPFAIGELMARMRAALRQSSAQDPAITRFDVNGLSVDADKRLVTRDGAAVRLTPKEYDLLLVLVRHAGRVVTQKQILREVWGPAHVDDAQYLRVFVGQLRSKIEKDPSTPGIILTEPGIGYRLAENS